MNIKTLVVLAVLTVLGTTGGWIVGRRTAPKQDVPEQSISVGFTFEMPCPEHGKHEGKILDTSLVRVYKAWRDDGEEATFTQEQLLGFFKELNITPK